MGFGGTMCGSRGNLRRNLGKISEKSWGNLGEIFSRNLRLRKSQEGVVFSTQDN